MALAAVFAWLDGETGLVLFCFSAAPQPGALPAASSHTAVEGQGGRVTMNQTWTHQAAPSALGGFSVSHRAQGTVACCPRPSEVPGVCCLQGQAPSRKCSSDRVLSLPSRNPLLCPAWGWKICWFILSYLNSKSLSFDFHCRILPWSQEG